MSEFHRCNDPIDDHRGTKARAEADKQHPAPFVTADRLHRRVIQDVGRPAEGLAKIKSNPTAPKIVRLRNYFAVQYYAWISDGNRIVSPVPGKLMYMSDHLTGRKIHSRFELPHLATAENTHLHVTSADV